MKWTDTKPAKAGFYFCKVKATLSGKTYTAVLKVYSTDLAAPDALDMIFWDGENYRLHGNDHVFLRWSERIEEPSDDFIGA